MKRNGNAKCQMSPNKRRERREGACRYEKRWKSEVRRVCRGSGREREAERKSRKSMMCMIQSRRHEGYRCFAGVCVHGEGKGTVQESGKAGRQETGCIFVPSIQNE